MTNMSVRGVVPDKSRIASRMCDVSVDVQYIYVDGIVMKIYARVLGSYPTVDITRVGN